ncbi:MerR family transcriptional regulator [Streptomyces heilongjiangensis]|uniref:MerR family transcriptional regulator n=1 Tax=Streptomyces heilongjiangensis TaxID=945052 RepID=A0ABW1BFP5_9ACTN|nr:MerR family transcriptional regulator [Streptomyces heilongjiangensis]MDC2951685.1 MerR family transcriptional regulator [Streptomyces heilongjiangensis]
MDAHEEPGTAGAGVTTGVLARRLGISPTTLRSWDRRYGLGPATRVEGRHRRWTAEDVAMVREMCRLTAEGVPPAEAARTAKAQAAAAKALAAGAGATAGPADDTPVAGSPFRPLAPVREPWPPADAAYEGPGSAETAPETLVPADTPSVEDSRRRCRGLARAAVRMDAEAVQEQITATVEAYGLLAAWEEVLIPTLRYVGRRWESSEDRYVEVEHLLSWHISVALRHAYARAAARNRASDTRPVLLACLPGEQHTLPLEALTAVLAERGRRVLMLGSSVPVEALEATVRRVAPAAVALWSQSRSTADLPLARHLAAIRWGIHGARTRSHVLLCGPGWGLRSDPDLLRPFGLADAVRIMASAGRPGDDAPVASEGRVQESV